MKKTIAVVLSICLVAFTNKNNFTELHIFEGSWQMKTAKSTIGEIWTKTNDHVLTSKAYYINGTDSIVYENVVLSKVGNDIFYTVTAANENNAQPVAFKLTSALNKKFVFENPTHDFPKRIVYEFINQDSIHAFIDDGKEASAKRSDFNFKRIK
jgi:hypothetical protein